MSRLRTDIRRVFLDGPYHNDAPSLPLDEIAHHVDQIMTVLAKRWGDDFAKLDGAGTSAQAIREAGHSAHVRCEMSVDFQDAAADVGE